MPQPVIEVSGLVKHYGKVVAVDGIAFSVAAGATAAQLAALEQYGRHLGLAFQITDDLLDVAGDQAAVGKRLAKDAARGKATYPSLLGVDESRGRAAALVEEACQALESFGAAGEPLRKLAQSVLDRTR